jgi:hypothetical protein
MGNVTWQVIDDINDNMTVAFFLDDELHTIISGKAEFITDELKRMSAAD